MEAVRAKASLKVHCTRDYDMFQVIEGNRIISLQKIARLQAAMEAKNLFAEYPIVVDRNNRILDGQHRFLAAKNLGLPIFYVISTTMEESDVAAVNCQQDKWKNRDFLFHYVSAGLQPYITAKTFMEKWSLSLDSSLEILGGVHGYYSKFRTGEFVVSDIGFANKVAKRILDYGQYFSTNKSRYFVRAIIKLSRTEAYNHNTMMERLKYLSKKLVKCPDTETYIKLLEEIINYKARTRVRFF